MRIGLICNGQLALPSLEWLLQTGSLAGLAHAVSMHPDTLQALNERVTASPVEPTPLSRASLAEDLAAWLDRVAPDCVFVQTFPHRIPATALSTPPAGFMNFHPGRLPAYRGPDPAFWQIRHGETTGAVSVHRMEPDFDTGPVLHVEPVRIEPEDTYGIHLTHLADATRCATVRLVDQLAAGAPLTGTPQATGEAAFQRLPTLHDLIVDWPNAPAHSVVDLCRAANPTRGGALTFFRGAPVRLFQATASDVDHPPRLPAGTVVSAGPEHPPQVLAADGRYLRLDLLQTDEGYYSGTRFTALYGVRIGEKFTTPSLS